MNFVCVSIDDGGDHDDDDDDVGDGFQKVFVCACVRACIRACVRACARIGQQHEERAWRSVRTTGKRRKRADRRADHSHAAEREEIKGDTNKHISGAFNGYITLCASARVCERTLADLFETIL